MPILQHKYGLWGAAGLLLLGGAILYVIRASGPESVPPGEGAVADSGEVVTSTVATAEAEEVFPSGDSAGLPAESFPPPDSQPTASSLSAAPPSEEPPGAAEPSLVSGASPPGTQMTEQPTEYDIRLTVMVGVIQSVRASGAEAGERVPVLLASAQPMEQASGLALMAGLGMQTVPHDLAAYSPEVVLAAVDLCGALFDDSSAQALLAEWMGSMGGARPAGEMAHTLLLEDQLPYGGGSTALDLMVSVNDPQAILVGLRLFAVDADLPAATRTEALLLLRDHMEFEAYREFVRSCVERARQEGSAWAPRAERLLARLEGPPAVVSGPQRVDPAVIENALAGSNPGAIEDLELYLRHETQAGRVNLDAEATAFFRESLADVDETALAGPDLAALQRLRRQFESWNPTP
jgi:hypothetical protein